MLRVTLCVQLFRHALKIKSVAPIYHAQLPNQIVLSESVPQVNITVGMENVFLTLIYVLLELHAPKLPQLNVLKENVLQLLGIVKWI